MKQAYYRKNRNSLLKKQAAYKRKNRKSISKKQAAYKRKNRKSISKKQAAYQRKNRKKIANYLKAYYRKNRKKLAKQMAAYQRKNRKSIAKKQAARNCKIVTRHAQLLSRHKRQLAPRGIKGRPMSLEAHRKKLYYADGRERPCWYCLGENNKMGSGLDRLDNNATYTVANTVPACRGCNVWRGATHTVRETRVHFKPMRDAARLAKRATAHKRKEI